MCGGGTDYSSSSHVRKIRLCILNISADDLLPLIKIMVFTVLGRSLWSLQEADWLLCGNNFFVGNQSALCEGGEGHGGEGPLLGSDLGPW